MLLQQLLQRNYQNVRQIYLDQKRKKKIFNDQNYQRRKPSQFKSRQEGLKLSVNNLLQNQVSQYDLIHKNKSTPRTMNQQSLAVTIDNFRIKDYQTYKIQSPSLTNNKNHRSQSKTGEQRFRTNSAQHKIYRTNSSHNKPTNENIKFFSVPQKQISTVGSNTQKPKFNSFDKGVFDLPDSFNLSTSKNPSSPKHSFSPFNGSHSTFINYDETLFSARQQSIHSRGRMRRQEKIAKSRKAQSQQNFYTKVQDFSRPTNRFSSLNDSSQIKVQKDSGLCLEIQKINLKHKNPSRNEYYRKSKAKLQKQYLITPWKKQPKHNNKSVDLTQLIQLHQY